MRAAFAAAINRSPAAFTDIRFERRRGTRIVRRGRDVESVAERRREGGVVRCFTPGRGWGVAGFGTLDALAPALRQAHELSLALRGGPREGPAPVPARKFELDCPAGRDPNAIARERKLRLTELAAERVLATDRRLADARVYYEDCLVETVVATSDGLDVVERRPEIALALLAVAEEGGTIERGLDSFSNPGDWDEIESWAGAAAGTAQRAIGLLHAAPVRAGRCPVVLDPRSTGLLLHRTIGHLCQADADGGSPAPLRLGTRVGPDLIDIGDDGTVEGLRGTRAFDHEGLASRKTLLVQHGVVVSHLHTRSSAAAAGVAPTGSARGAPGEAPRARLSNTFLANGSGELDELIQGVALGVYLAEPVGAAFDGSRLVLRAGAGRMIRGGELAEPIKGGSVAGDPLALLGAVDRVGGDFQWDRSAAWCAHGRRGPVAIGTGAPHVRLVEAPVGEDA